MHIIIHWRPDAPKMLQGSSQELINYKSTQVAFFKPKFLKTENNEAKE
jgi:hypothetical protein